MKTDLETRQRLLAEGARLFAERGFKEVTVREICSEAGANVAAVNYHFGDKLGLYREVLEGAIRVTRDATETARAQGDGLPPEEKLRHYVRVFLERVVSPGHERIYRILHREFDDPTTALDTFAERAVRPRVAYLAGVVAEIIGCAPEDQRALRCAASVQALFVVYMPNPIARRLGFRYTGTPEEIDQAARHITEFSLAGIRAVASGKRFNPGPRRSASGAVAAARSGRSLAHRERRE